MPRIGLIGGTGFSTTLHDAERLRVDTPWGEVEVAFLRRGGLDAFFVRRHGAAHAPPHRIVHRANVDALARCGVDAILALNTVGALDPSVESGALLVPDDLIDLRKRTETFHEERAVHVDFAEPYCGAMRARLVDAAAAEGAPARDGGTYVCTEGPRLETRAEVRMMRAMGGSVVGMTGCPEATLARERAICYASLCLVTNHAAGVAPAPPSAAAIKARADAMAPLAMRVVLRAAERTGEPRACACRDALRGAGL